MSNAFVTQPAGLIHDDEPDVMALRDYFAATAMQSMVVGPAVRCNPGELPENAVARMAYQMANAMLKAREQNGYAA